MSRFHGDWRHLFFKLEKFDENANVYGGLERQECSEVASYFSASER
jgi:hypothetical protein